MSQDEKNKVNTSGQERLIEIIKDVSAGNYSDDIMELTKSDYPDNIREIAEAVGMMMVKIEAREFELTQKNEKLIEVQKAKNDFISIASHELLTPITEMTMYYDFINWLDRDFIEENSEFVDTAVTAIKKSINWLSKNIWKIIEVLRMPQTKKILDLSEFSVVEFLNELRTNFQKIMEQRNLEYIVKIPENDIKIYADKDRIYHALFNVIHNAIKYTPDNGKIIIKTEIDNNSELLKFIISDTGIGISNEHIEKIFDKFYEVQDILQHSSGTFEFNAGGIGLGLTITKNIIEAHNGKIKVQSELDKGSTFELTVPFQCKL